MRVPITAVSGSTTGSYASYASLSRAPASTSRRALPSASTELPSRANDSRIPGDTASGIRPTNERARAAAVSEAVRAAERSPPCTLTRRSSITALVNAVVASIPSPTICAADRCWSALSDSHHPRPTTAQTKTSEGTTAIATTRDRREAKRPDLGAAAGMLMRISFSIPERSEPVLGERARRDGGRTLAQYRVASASQGVTDSEFAHPFGLVSYPACK